MSSPFQLPSGPIFGPRFLVVCWLSFRDGNTGQSCFETHTILQTIAVAIRYRENLQNMQYASVMQGGTFA